MNETLDRLPFHGDVIGGSGRQRNSPKVGQSLNKNKGIQVQASEHQTLMLLSSDHIASCSRLSWALGSLLGQKSEVGGIGDRRSVLPAALWPQGISRRPLSS